MTSNKAADRLLVEVIYKLKVKYFHLKILFLFCLILKINQKYIYI